MAGDEDYNYLYKIILVGDALVGKTHLLSRFSKGTLPKNSHPTIGVEFSTCTIPLVTGGKVKAQIWDTAGQERYRAITSAHFRRTVGALLVYDITSENSFMSTRQWLQELKEKADPDIVIMLVGNKLDLCEQNPQARVVSRETGAKFAYENGLLFEETSALTVVKVTEVFDVLVQSVHKVRELNGAEMNPTLLANRMAAPDLNARNDQNARYYGRCCM